MTVARAYVRGTDMTVDMESIYVYDPIFIVLYYIYVVYDIVYYTKLMISYHLHVCMCDVCVRAQVAQGHRRRHHTTPPAVRLHREAHRRTQRLYQHTCVLLCYGPLPRSCRTAWPTAPTDGPAEGAGGLFLAQYCEGDACRSP